jgi:hypothetical protein
VEGEVLFCHSSITTATTSLKGKPYWVNVKPLAQGFNGMDLGLKASFMYWNPAQSGTFGSSPRLKDRERNNY